MKKHLVTAATLLTIGIIAGCGGSGSTATNPTSTGKSVIAGTVADGYLVGATVFLDRNNNYLLDEGEPSVATGSDGSYTLPIDQNDLDINGKLKYPIVALAIKDKTVDLDNPGQPVQNTYVLSMHAVSVDTSASGNVTGTVSNFISPISTQIRELMETGKYATIQEAATALRKQLGMPPGIDMSANYFKFSSYSSAMHTAARNMATLMGGQMTQVMGASGAPSSLNVNRYRGMMGTIFSNMSSLRGTNAQTGMTNLMGTMTTVLSNMPMSSTGQPFRNMSAAFRGGMMGGTKTSTTGGMMGGTTTSTTAGTGTGPATVPGGMMGGASTSTTTGTGTTTGGIMGGTTTSTTAGTGTGPTTVPGGMMGGASTSTTTGTGVTSGGMMR